MKYKSYTQLATTLMGDQGSMTRPIENSDYNWVKSRGQIKTQKEDQGL